jgi:alpha-1,3-mannosyl-glycoprotein beta-1,2-N-acetylglucosaminyltransferase
MVRVGCGARIGLLAAAVFFMVVQMRLFAVQSHYADRIASAVENENECIRLKRNLIDKYSSQQGRVIALEEERERLENKFAQLTLLVQDYQSRDRSRKQSQNIVVEGEIVAAVVIMACNRPDYLERTLKSVLKYQIPVAGKFPLFVSQDGSMEAVKVVAKGFPEVTYLQHVDGEPLRKTNPQENDAYYKIASHYKWALTELFNKRSFSRVIILEDDMEIAPDFFDYFEATSWLLEEDKSVVAVSSWNDNGQRQFVYDSKAIYRSDFFPGLGWMLTNQFWEELRPKWPAAYWDDWLRLNSTRKGRHFIRPEVCRTYNFGEHGSSMGQFFKQYLEPIKLNDVAVNWKSKDLGFLQEERFNREFAALIARALPLPNSQANVVKMAESVGEDVRIEYSSQRQFEGLARLFGVFEEWKDGVPRTAYKGVVVFRWMGKKKIYFLRPDSLKLLGFKGEEMSQ